MPQATVPQANITIVPTTVMASMAMVNSDSYMTQWQSASIFASAVSISASQSMFGPNGQYCIDITVLIMAQTPPRVDMQITMPRLCDITSILIPLVG